MRNGTVRLIGMILSVVLMRSGVLAETQEEWRAQLQSTKKAQTSFTTAGVVVGIVGIGATVMGNSDVSDAAKTQGCSSDGLFEITCVDEQSAAEANQKLKSGRRKVLLGIGALIAGGIFLITGNNKKDEVRRLENRGKKNGWAFGMDFDGSDEVMLLAQRRY